MKLCVLVIFVCFILNFCNSKQEIDDHTHNRHQNNHKHHSIYAYQHKNHTLKHHHKHHHNHNQHNHRLNDNKIGKDDLNSSSIHHNHHNHHNKHKESGKMITVTTYNDHFNYNNKKWRKTREEHDDVETFDSDWNTKTPEYTTERQFPKIKPVKPMDTEKRVCVHHRFVQIPYRITEVYQKPILRQYTEPCQGQKICTGVRVVHEPAYRSVVKHRQTKQVIYSCCNGWEKENPDSLGCDKPVCLNSCKNGGTCIKPNTCSCPIGWTGDTCEIDINECIEEKPCDQSCFNTEGSYYCTCRDGFYLHSDKQSCKKIGGFNIEDAFETRDLESNDIDYDEMQSRIEKVEKAMSSDKQQLMKLINEKYNSAMDTISRLLVRIDTLEHRQTDLSKMTGKLKEYDNQSRRVEQLIALLHKCRTKQDTQC